MRFLTATLKANSRTTVQVYNFEVDYLHSYCVGESGVLVHNANYDVANVSQDDLEDFYTKMLNDPSSLKSMTSTNWFASLRLAFCKAKLCRANPY